MSDVLNCFPQWLLHLHIRQARDTACLCPVCAVRRKYAKIPSISQTTRRQSHPAPHTHAHAHASFSLLKPTQVPCKSYDRSPVRSKRDWQSLQRSTYVGLIDTNSDSICAHMLLLSYRFEGCKDRGSCSYVSSRFTTAVTLLIQLTASASQPASAHDVLRAHWTLPLVSTASRVSASQLLCPADRDYSLAQAQVRTATLFASAAVHYLLLCYVAYLGRPSWTLELIAVSFQPRTLTHAHMLALLCSVDPKSQPYQPTCRLLSTSSLRTPRLPRKAHATPGTPHRVCDHRATAGQAGRPGYCEPHDQAGHGSVAVSLIFATIAHIPLVRNVGLGTDCGSTASIDVSVSEQKTLGML